MRKLKPIKSAFASGVPPCPVTLEGDKPFKKDEILSAYNGLLIVLAAIIEQNKGRVIVSEDSIATVKRKKRVLQIVPSHVGVSFQFNDFKDEDVISVPEEIHDFLGSALAQEAREFLAKQKENHDSN